MPKRPHNNEINPNQNSLNGSTHENPPKRMKVEAPTSLPADNAGLFDLQTFISAPSVIWTYLNKGKDEALFKAIELGCSNLIPDLISRGADVEACIPIGALNQKVRRLDMISFYCKNVRRNNPHIRVIEYAVCHNNLDAVRLLMHYGVNIHDSKDGTTPLHWAATFGHVDMVRFLVKDCGVNINVRDARGKTPFRLAKGHCNYDTFRFFINDIETAQTFIDKVPSRKDVDLGFWRPLQLWEFKIAQILIDLIEEKKDDKKDCGRMLAIDQNKLLTMAAIYGDGETINRLLNWEAVREEPNCGWALSANGNRSVEYAAARKELKTLKRLLTYPEVVAEEVWRDNLTLQKAEKKGRQAVYDILMEVPELRNHELNHEDQGRAGRAKRYCIEKSKHAGRNFALFMKEVKADDNTALDLYKKLMSAGLIIPDPSGGKLFERNFLTAYRATRNAIKEKEAKGFNVDALLQNGKKVLLPSP